MKTNNKLIMILTITSLIFITSCGYNNSYIVNTKENYGSLHYHNDTADLTITVSNPDTYYNITGLECGVKRFMNCSSSDLIITENGDYTLEGSFSFGGGANNEYEIEIFINGLNSECDLHRKLGTGGDTGSASITCLKSLNLGDVVDLRVEDETNPTSDLEIHSLNFNVVRIG